jgi:hypothetical protein
MIKLLAKIFLLILSIVSATVIWQQSLLMVLALNRIDPLPETHIMVAEKRYAEASDFLSFFMEYDYVNQNQEAQSLYQEISTKRESWDYLIKKLVEGLFSGTSDEMIGQIAGVATDFIVIGDLRDIAKQGFYLAKGEEVDEVLVALSAIGIAATGAQIVSGAATVASKGVTAPTVVGTTVTKSSLIALKTARKLGKFPAWLSKTIIKTAKSIKQTKSLGNLTSIFGDVSALAKTSGGFYLMSKAKDAASLSRMANFAKTFGPQSSTMYHIGGGLAVKVAQQAGTIGIGTIKYAATFGQTGLRILDKVGVLKFTKFASRSLKMGYKGDVCKLLAMLLLMLPIWSLYLITLFGVIIWVPWHAVSRLGNRSSSNVAHH